MYPKFYTIYKLDNKNIRNQKMGAILVSFGVALFIIFILGTIGNVLSICVMQSKQLRHTNAAMIVTFISIFDTIYLFFRNLAFLFKYSGGYHSDRDCLFTNTISVVMEVCLSIYSRHVFFTTYN